MKLWKVAALAAVAVGLQTGCASYEVARDVKLARFEDPAAPERTIGLVQGDSCRWSIFGWLTGPEPTIYEAIQRAQSQKKEALVPGDHEEQLWGGSIKSIRNVSSSDSAWNIWILGRRCITVTGTGTI